MADVVLQSESIKGVVVWHITVMNDNAIRELGTYSAWENHQVVAHYLCCGQPSTEYRTWDRLDTKSLERMVLNREALCPACLGIIEGSE